MLVLREYIEDKLTEVTPIDFDGDRTTIGRAGFADIAIGQNFHPVIQRSISRIQATLVRDDSGEISITDGGDQLSACGVWFKGKRIIEFLVLDANQPVILFEWQKASSERIQGWNAVRIEIENEVVNRQEPTTGPGNWQTVSDRVQESLERMEALAVDISSLKGAFEQQREDYAMLDLRLEQKIDDRVAGQLTAVKRQLEDNNAKDERRSSEMAGLARENANVTRQNRLFNSVILLVLSASVVITGVQGVKGKDPLLDLVKALIPPIGLAIVTGKLLHNKKKK